MAEQKKKTFPLETENMCKKYTKTKYNDHTD